MGIISARPSPGRYLAIRGETPSRALCLETRELRTGRFGCLRYRRVRSGIGRWIARARKERTAALTGVAREEKREENGKERRNRCSVQTVLGLCFPKRKDPRWAFIRARTHTQHVCRLTSRDGTVAEVDVRATTTSRSPFEPLGADRAGFTARVTVPGKFTRVFLARISRVTLSLFRCVLTRHGSFAPVRLS